MDRRNFLKSLAAAATGMGAEKAFGQNESPEELAKERQEVQKIIEKARASNSKEEGLCKEYMGSVDASKKENIKRRLPDAAAQLNRDFLELKRASESKNKFNFMAEKEHKDLSVTKKDRRTKFKQDTGIDLENPEPAGPPNIFKK